jgi:hypothetical protein
MAIRDDDVCLPDQLVEGMADEDAMKTNNQLCIGVPVGFLPWLKGCRMRRAATQEPATAPPLVAAGAVPRSSRNHSQCLYCGP